MGKKLERPDLAHLSEGWAFFERVMVPPSADLEAEYRARAVAEERRAAEAEERLKANVASALPRPLNPDEVTEPWHESRGLVGPVLELYSRENVDSYAKRFADQPDEKHRLKAVKALLVELRRRGNLRSLKALPQNWEEELQALKDEFPNFGEVLEHVRVQFARAAYQEGVATMRPILLAGPPGVGKSMFAAAFARWLDTGLVTVRMETSQSAAAISGTAEFWSNSKPGRVFEELVYGKYANPVVFVDEIDKVTVNRYDPLNSMLPMLEPGTAKEFADESYPWLKLDASQVTWVLAANETQYLPGPFLSRVRLFNVPAPTVEQSRRIAKRMFDTLRGTMPGDLGDFELTEQALAAVVKLAPRRMAQVLEDALGRALLANRLQVTEADVVLPDVDKAEKRQMGFAPARLKSGK